MTPAEIALLKRSSPALQAALLDHHTEVWPFLRNHVERRYHPIVQGPHTCEQCSKATYLPLSSPYSAYSPWLPGLCFDCVLWGFLSDAPYYRTPEQIAEDEATSYAWEPPEGVLWS